MAQKYPNWIAYSIKDKRDAMLIYKNLIKDGETVFLDKPIEDLSWDSTKYCFIKLNWRRIDHKSIRHCIKHEFKWCVFDL